MINNSFQQRSVDWSAYNMYLQLSIHLHIMGRKTTHPGASKLSKIDKVIN